MKKYLFGILFIIVALAGNSFAQNRRADFSMSEPTEEDCSIAGTCYYVDNAVSSSGDGSSWNKAWKSFANINWSQINPGNTIYISGGTSSKTYKEKLVVRASGTLGKQIKITKGVDAGHNGQAIIDGTGISVLGASPGSSHSGIAIAHTYDYITVSNLSFDNWGYGAIHIQGAKYDEYSYANAAVGIILENNNISVDGRLGVFVVASNNIIIRNTYIHTPNWVDYQTDGIFSSLNRDNLYENNKIIINNQEPSGHDDCIQSYRDIVLTVKGNYLEQNNKKVSNAQGLWIESSSGAIKVYDNIINLRDARSGALKVYGFTDASSVEIIGNTVFANHSNVHILVIDFDNPVIKNNIGTVAVACDTNLFGLNTKNRASITINPALISNNLLRNPGSINIATVYGLGSLTQARLEANGINLGGLNVDPQFRNPANKDFTPMNPAVCTASDTGSYIGAVPCTITCTRLP